MPRRLLGSFGFTGGFRRLLVGLGSIAAVVACVSASALAQTPQQAPDQLFSEGDLKLVKQSGIFQYPM